MKKYKNLSGSHPVRREDTVKIPEDIDVIFHAKLAAETHLADGEL